MGAGSSGNMGKRRVGAKQLAELIDGPKFLWSCGGKTNGTFKKAVLQSYTLLKILFCMFEKIHSTVQCKAVDKSLRNRLFG